MNETITTIVGNVVDAPSRRVLESGVCVTSFRVASTARRFDRVTNRWADGDSLYLKVTCWRALAENAAASLVKGDPVVVTGRLYTRLYTVAESQRAAYELEATAIGFDFNRGRATFQRISSRPTLTVDEAGADGLPSGGAVDAHIDTAVKPVDGAPSEERNPFHDDPIDASTTVGDDTSTAPDESADTAGSWPDGRSTSGVEETHEGADAPSSTGEPVGQTASTGDAAADESAAGVEKPAAAPAGGDAAHGAAEARSTEAGGPTAVRTTPGQGAPGHEPGASAEKGAARKGANDSAGNGGRVGESGSPRPTARRRGASPVPA